MPKQLSLLKQDTFRLEVPTDTREPLVWFKRLVIWSDPKTEIRSISFQPGLNIIWSPDSAEQTESNQAKALGHGSGKTLLCRMLRYCLGEDRYSTAELRNSILLTFPQGIVGAEIMIAGTLWAVLRPIGTRRLHYAIPATSLEDIIAGDFDQTTIDPLLSILEQKVMDGEAISLLPGASAHHGWLTALALLSRDQECHLNHPLEYRSPDTDSGSPVRSLSLTGILDSLRVMIGAVNPVEFELRSKIKRLEVEHKNSIQEFEHLNWQIKRLKKKLATQLNLTENNLSPGPIGVKLFLDAAEDKISNLKGAELVDEKALTSQRRKANQAQQLVHELSIKLESIDKTLIPAEKRQISFIKGELPRFSISSFQADNPSCPVCEVPVDRVLAEGCKLSHKFPNSHEIKKRWANLEKDLEVATRRLTNLEEQRTITKSDLINARRDADTQSQHLTSIEKKERSQKEAWYKARRTLDEVNQLEELLLAKEKTDISASKLAITIEDKRQETGKFRAEQAHVISQLSSLFNTITKELIGVDAKGKISIDGNGLKLSVEMGGERSTAAIDSLKVIAFDLAIMCMSMEGRTHLPALLIHDSPREADLGLSVYHSLFDFAQQLERQTVKPVFQYIVTTTTKPPDQLLQKPWLCETISGAPAETRLLRRDL